MSPATRLFLALTPHGAATERLLAMQSALRGRHAAHAAGAVRWISSRQFHLTLSFLGAAQAWCRHPGDPRLAIQACVERVCSQHEPLELEIEERLVIFGEPEQAKAVVAGVGQASMALGALHAALIQELALLGFSAETRAYRPHVTLARIKHRGSVEPWVHPAAPLPATPGARQAEHRFHAESVALFDSAMTPAGGVYTELARFALGRAR